MSMLELITKASATSNESPSDSQYPIVLNPDPILLNLNPKTNDSFINRVEGWKISELDAQVIELAQKFYKNLKIKLKNPNSFTKVEFVNMLNLYLEKSKESSGISIGIEPKDEGFSNAFIRKFGFLMGEAVLGLVIEACFVFEIWEILETLIEGGLVNGSVYKDLVGKLIEKRRADLVCLSVKYVSDLQVSDVLSVLRFFLCAPKDGYGSMVDVRNEWERQAVSAIEIAADKSLGVKKLNKAKDAAVLLVMAHDEFTTSELCLHYLISSSNVDDVILSACIGKLNGLEIMSFVRYLKKWLVKYQKFPEACLSGKSSQKGVESVPSLENVTKCFGLVIDEHFSSLVMHLEFVEEVKSIELVVNSLASEARICCTLANLCASLKN
ncbi:uncharacterized protein [Rutidosis leptorrhynchoides]|uniref:uncharacterized protein n=1 Tax=Rutidosis leptorrhynchoides TaxID=125765 RepID=UPI003A9981F2